MSRYPVVLEEDDNSTVLVSFPDFPEAHTFGDTKEDALAHAVDALETVIDAYIKDRRPIPEPSPIAADAVDLPALMAAKVQIYDAMCAQRVNKSELARRMDVHLPQIDRLLTMKHGSKLDQLEAAAKALGGRLEVAFMSANLPARQLSYRSRVAIRKRMLIHPGVLASARTAAQKKARKRR